MPFIIEYILSLAKSKEAFAAHQDSPETALTTFAVDGVKLRPDQIRILLSEDIDAIRLAIQNEVNAIPEWLTEFVSFPVHIDMNVGHPPKHPPGPGTPTSPAPTPEPTDPVQPPESDPDEDDDSR